jgi:hypothetical protein
MSFANWLHQGSVEVDETLILKVHVVELAAEKVENVPFEVDHGS